MSFLSEGKETELEFGSLFKNFDFSSKEEDINEHWDLKISFKYDVKSVKKISRNDLYPNELYHFIEIKNVNGDNGWLYGDADYFVFETFKYFIIVSKEKLQKFISENIIKTYVTTPDKSLYCLYSRENKKDVITMVTSIDLCVISESIKHKQNTPYILIGESIIPEKRAKERLEKLFDK